MKAIKLAFLFHQHQPYYRQDNEFILPWVRFHAVKDYYDLLILLDEFPNIKQSFNVVPSLILQLKEYLSGEVRDRVQMLSYKHPSELSLAEKQQIIDQFFICNFENLIKPYPRYFELFNRAKNSVFTLESFTVQDWLDLQVWYNLTWVGNISRLHSPFQKFFKKGQNFTQEEKFILLDAQIKLISEIIPTFQRLSNLGQIEISISPFFHPILPLLIDNYIGKESNSNLHLHIDSFRYPDDARLQIKEGKKFILENLSIELSGLWPSEGALSTDTLILISEEGFRWSVTDPKLLFKTFPNIKSSSKYFPYLFSNNEKNLWLFFRDTGLSDAIGFTYQHWDPDDAVVNFITRILDIRNQIIEDFGEEYLDLACIPVVLDGENCWEFYKDNGIPFLRKLYERIANESLIQTVTFSEACPSFFEYPFRIEKLSPGSWINGNFDTWIGQPAKQKAWYWLEKIRALVEKHSADKESYDRAMKLVLVAEGSDWFWWYGDDNIAPNKKDFDILFRWYLKEILKTIGEQIPEELNYPLDNEIHPKLFVPASKKINDSQFKNIGTDLGWGCFYAHSEISSMHSSEELISEIFFGNSRDFFYIGFKLLRELNENDTISIYLLSPIEAKFEIKKDLFVSNLDRFKNIGKIIFKYLDDIFFGITLDSLFEKKNDFEGKIINFSVVSCTLQTEFHFPKEGSITHVVI